MTADHKPENRDELWRIKENGGKVYKSRSRSKNKDSSTKETWESASWIYRIFPGKLSVSRSIGDFKAK